MRRTMRCGRGVGRGAAGRRLRRRRPRSRAATRSSPTTRSCSACSTTSPASTRSCPARTRSRPSRWRSTTSRRSTATRRSPRTSTVETADHQNKPDIANTKAQEMYDRQKARHHPRRARPRRPRWPSPTWPRQKKKLYINIGAAHHRPDRQVSCNKYTFHYAYDTVHAGQRHRHRDHRGRRQELVHRLPRLRLRPGHGEDLHRPRSRRPAARSSASDPTPFPNDNFSTFLLKAPTLNPKPDVLGTMQAGARPGQLRQAVQRVQAAGQGRRPGGRPDVHHRHPLARPRRAGRHHVHRRVVLELRRAEPGVGRQVPGRRPAPGPPSPTPPTTRRRCSTWRPSRRPAPTTPTPWSSSSRARRSTTSSCATARSAPRTTG